MAVSLVESSSAAVQVVAVALVIRTSSCLVGCRSISLAERLVVGLEELDKKLELSLRDCKQHVKRCGDVSWSSL